MPHVDVWCILPLERSDLCARIRSAGATPILDLRYRTATSVAVPSGVGVWVTSTVGAPGDGPIVAATGPAVPGRECWREVGRAGPVPEGYAGLVLRGSECGGASGLAPSAALLTEVPAGVRVRVEHAGPPESAPTGVEGIVLADVLFAAFAPPRLAERLARLTAGDIFVHEGFRFVGSAASPARRRLASGETAEALACDYFTADDARDHVWPGADGLLQAGPLLRAHGSLEGLVQAYVGEPVAQPAASSPAQPTAPAAATAPDEDPVVHFVVREPIAIIGLGCRLPAAPSVPRLWEQLLAGFSGIVDVPVTRWDPALFWDADKEAPDRTYARIGGFVTDFTFNPRRFRIPPSSARLIDPIQQMALEAAADALEDAGYGSDRAFDRERVAVILGNSMGGEITNEYTVRVMFPALRKALEEVPGFAALPDRDRAMILAGYEAQVKANLPPITEDSMPGELSNVVAGRITNALNLGGPNFTTDAACAGSMAAIQAAVKGLQDGDFDMALSGGADRSMSISTYIKFCKIGALSPDGSRPFDADANGFVMGEGTGILVLKRLADAERDGDRVYAVIRGFGASSDGKGKGITAPNPAGQMRALRRAYQDAGVDPASVDLWECHGTSTVVGDKVEVECLAELLGDGGRKGRGPARIGSIKSNIGHLKSAAGAASMLKATLALHHKVLPPSANYQKPRNDLPLGRVPLQVQTQAEPWTTTDVRRVGVSAFGFGGTNFHAVLEEHRPGLRASLAVPLPSATAPTAPSASPVAVPVAAVARPAAAAVPAAPASTEPARPPRPSSAVPVPPALWALSADTPEEMIARCRALKRGHVSPYEPDAPLRLVAAAETSEERDGQLDKAISALQKGKGYDLLRSRGIYLEDVPCDGQLAFLFTGQGSQYVGMGLDLAETWPIVADTFREADEVLLPLLGRKLTDIVRRDPSRPEDEQFEELRATEISQPATLTVDVAILRLLSAYGVQPDMVAGHSLGEYGAAVAAGMLSFRDALIAVSARGREMAAVKLDDFGKMAGIATSAEVVAAVLAEIPGYVVAANKNCPTQTVIAGESEAVEAAIEAFKSRGVTVYPLPVSHAFHSRIVAPASEPLKRVLAGLDLVAPRRRITTNVDSRYYPTGPDARERAIDILARQVASPVEWISQIERMYSDGARIFVECGPKRALTGFVVNILKHRPHRALYTNQPKRGGVYSFYDALAALLALGFPVQPSATATTDLFSGTGPRRSTSRLLEARAESRTTELQRGESTHGTPSIEREIVRIVAARTGYPIDALDPDFDLEADLGIDTVKQADLIGAVREHFRMEQDPSFRMSDHRTLRSLIDYAGRQIGSTRPGSVPARRAAVPETEATLPADVAAKFLADIAGKDLRGLDGAAFAEAMLPALQSFLGASWAAFQAARGPASAEPPRTAPAEASRAAAPPPAAMRTESPPLRPSSGGVPALVAATLPRPRIVCSGASLGLPGGEEVFSPDNVASILRGDNRIGPVPEDQRQKMVDKGLVRLVKDSRTGQGEFVPVNETSQVIRLAGRKARFDLVADYGIDASLARSLDITTQLAFAAGLEALKDAGIPLVRTWKATSNGKQVATGWALPASMRESTGIVFASAFPGYDQLLQKLRTNGDDGEGHFDRRFLFQVLSMGHSQFAQLVQAKGPNTAVNAACASTTQAISIAEDWLRLGRCERVIVVGADDVTGDELLQWIGAGFLAAGAATTEADVTTAALPFDRRRHGMILGMGAVAMVLEHGDQVEARGRVPIAELLGTRISNSAFHGTRLDADHISREVTAFAKQVLAVAGVDASTFARRCIFMSHETYTPARGGSAAAEMASLPAAFGPDAKHIVIANTKGFTGHPMGAGIEDAIAVKALQYKTAPPIANLKEPDPDLGELSLSKGGPVDIEYALRLAAGFGSQLALAAWRKIADGDKRVSDERRAAAWLTAEAGPGHLVVEHRQLRYVADPAPPATQTAPPTQAAPATAPATQTTPATAPATQTAPATGAARAGAPSTATVIKDLVALIAQKSGYDPAEVDPGYELEADLGIDTVKQAEIFGEMRDRYGLERDDSFKLSDYPTVTKLAGYLADRAAGASGAAGVPVADPVPPAAAASPAAAAAAASPSAASTPRVTREEMLAAVLGVVSKKTGYEAAELDPNYELEADLGIDTVKQAEIFGEVRERYGLARDDNFKLSDYPTIARLSDYLADRAGQGGSPDTPPPASPAPAPASPAPTSPPPTPPAPTSPPPTPPAPTGPTRGADDAADGVLAALLEVIAKKTGYDVAEIDPGFDLEADLGIDTVKQAEIFGEMREHYGLERDDSFKLSDYATVAKLAGWLGDRVRAQSGSAAAVAPAPTPAASPPEATPAASASPDAPEAARIAAPMLSEAMAPLEPAVSHAEADFWPVLDDADPVRPTPPSGMPASFRIRRVARALAQPWGELDLAGVRVAVVGPEDLAQAVRAELDKRGAGRDGAPQMVVDVGAPLMELFALARRLDATPPSRWFAVCRGALEPSGAVEEGARAGFAKALGREWAGCTARVLTLDPALVDEDAAVEIVDELRAVDGATEVWRDVGERSVGMLDTDPFPPRAAAWKSPVVLLTGGTRGITARVARAIAERGPCTLHLIGRTGPGAEPLDEAAARSRIKADIQADGGRATPRLIEDRLRPLRVAEEVRQTVEDLEALGATVEVHTLDVAKDAAVRALVNRLVDQHGRIDVCVHGAGAEESRRLADKDEVAFERVYAGKVNCGLALAESLPAETFLVCMGSVAGRFGNPGQVDYAAANEALAQICRVRPSSLHIAWTAWGDTGMAVRGGMESLLTGRGVELLPAGPGAALVYDLVGAGITGEIVVAGALGDFPLPAPHPLLDKFELVGDDGIGTFTLTLASAPWITDHAIEGVPVLPGVIGLELMAAVATGVMPRGRYAGAVDVKFQAPVKLHRDEPVIIEITATPDGEGQVYCRLVSRRTARTGRELRTEHFEARIQMEDMPLLPALTPMWLPEERIECEAIYRRFFHGPGFQVLHHADAVAVQGLRATASVDQATIAGRLLTDPLALEAALQASGLHRMVTQDRMELPSAIDAVEWAQPVTDGDPLTITAQARGEVYDIDVVGPHGAVLRIRGYRGVERAPLSEGDRFPAPVGGWLSTAIATAAEAPDNLPATDLAALTARGNAQRQADRLAGQLAGRRAVGAIAHTAVFEIGREASGEPVVNIPGLVVSISHQSGEALAIAARNVRLGVDMERHEPRHPGFAREWFTEREQEKVGTGLSLTRAWAVKEAVLKLLGTGMAISPREVEVLDITDRRATVVLLGEAGRRHTALGGGSIQVRLGELGRRVVAVALLAIET